MIVVRPVSDETGHAEDADQGEDDAAAPGRDRDPRHQDDRVDDGSGDRRCFLSDRGDDENVDDQHDEKGAETPLTGSSSTGHGIGRRRGRQICFFSFCQSVSFGVTLQSSTSAPMGFPNLSKATVPTAASPFAAS